MRSSSSPTVHIAQGEYSVGSASDDIIATLLGSCVAVCLHDPDRQVGGMNHILLPDVQGASPDVIHGVNMMELLINGLLKAGAVKDRLQAKIFGGGKMVAGLSDIGSRNVDFARRFLADERISCIGESVGGSQGRRVEFWPATGRARQRLVEAPTELPPPPPKPAVGNDLELF